MDGVSYLINDSGDVWARASAEGPVEMDPADFGWRSPQSVDPPEERLTVDEVMAMPDFTVVVTDGERWVPGRRPPRAAKLADGRAPPVAMESRGGVDGTLAYFDRLTDALGRVVRRASARPERCPFVVQDFVSGRRIEVTHTPPPLGPGGEGRVYFVTDGDGLKIGFTVNPVAARIAGPQTGNPRTIRPVLTIHHVGAEVELALHRVDRAGRGDPRGRGVEGPGPRGPSAGHPSRIDTSLTRGRASPLPRTCSP